MEERRLWWRSRWFLHNTGRHGERYFDSALTTFLHGLHQCKKDAMAVLSPHFYMAHADVRKDTLAVLSPHFYMAHADVRKEDACGALSPEARYENAWSLWCSTTPSPPQRFRHVHNGIHETELMYFSLCCASRNNSLVRRI